jgi:anti-sigma factor RsiW
MNCTRTLEMLPALVYGDLQAADRDEAQSHVAACPSCRQEWQELMRVTQLLDAAPLPETHVDVAAVYSRALEIERRGRARWRRWAWGLGAAAAAVLLALCLRVELRWHDKQLVIGWGTPAPAVKAPPPGVPQEHFAAVADQMTKDAQLMRELVHALAANVNDRAERQDEELARLRRELEVFVREAEVRWLGIENTQRALYTARFGSTNKGDVP